MDDKTTLELLQIIQSAPLTAEASAALTELFDRVIEEDEDDDVIMGTVPVCRGGIRPKNQPMIPV